MCGDERLHRLQPFYDAPHILSELSQGQKDLLLKLEVISPFWRTFWTISSSVCPARTVCGSWPCTSQWNTTFKIKQSLNLSLKSVYRPSSNSFDLHSLQLWCEPSRPLVRLLFLPLSFASFRPSPTCPATTCLDSICFSCCWSWNRDDSKATWPLRNPFDSTSGTCPQKNKTIFTTAQVYILDNLQVWELIVHSF